MLTEVISKLDRVVLELALKDAFYDMCFYEGEEFTADLEKYLSDVKSKTNTEEQNTAFFETSMPYIERSVMTYGSSLFEGPHSVVVGADWNKVIGQTHTGAEASTSQIQDGAKKLLHAAKNLTEAEEAQVWEKVTTMLFTEGVILEGVKKSKGKKGAGPSATAQSFTKNFKGFSIPDGNTPNPSENK